MCGPTENHHSQREPGEPNEREIRKLKVGFLAGRLNDATGIHIRHKFMPAF